MIARRRNLIIAALSVAVLTVVIFRGRLFLGKWSETSDSAVTQAYMTAKDFAPHFMPTGDWVVSIGGAAGDLERELGRLLVDGLPRLNSDRGRVTLVESIADGTQPVNTLRVDIRSNARWTPFYAAYSDTVDLKYSNMASGQWPETPMALGNVTSNQLRARAAIAASGKASGIIGRPYVSRHRAEILADLIIKAIDESYRRVKTAAMKGQ